MKTLQQIPVPVAVLIMVVLILIGVAFGNHNTLSDAKAAPEVILTEVSAAASERASKAKNLLVVAKRNDVSDQSVTALQDAIAALEDATRAGRVGRMASANDQLTFAAGHVNTELQASAGEQDRRLATGVMDELGSAEKILSRQAALYNEGVGEVRKLYNRLPMRWLIGGMPEVFQ